MMIVALGLGKYKTVAGIYSRGKAEFITLNTCRQEFTEFHRQHAANVVVFEISTAAGWLSDLCDELGQPFFDRPSAVMNAFPSRLAARRYREQTHSPHSTHGRRRVRC